MIDVSVIRRITLVAALASLAACAPGLGTRGQLARWPLEFKRHTFDVYCFDTYGCSVKYAGLPIATSDPNVLTPSIASYGDRYPSFMRGSFGGMRTFPPPASLTWRSKEGEPLQAAVDFDRIFRDRRVLHQVPIDNASRGSAHEMPAILLEIEDRTVRVYMKAMVGTKTLRTPDNPYSDFRHDLMLAYERTY